MRRVPDKQQSSFCVNKLVQFCKRTDLHGYKYIVMDELTFAERCCWAVCVTVSVILAAYFVACAYAWYARNPIVTRFVVERQIRGSAVGCMLHGNACCRQASTIDFRELTPHTI
ncbi:hypothetical protein EVAR_66541_1 [Eumeta japonica]|uniref:Uncharacterized protein n=1 Tax=Eumeta variegata TaxID=151549 RepID=A0A4C2A014_EUMVA|nr:hypothetical protein EVAR_66541_1 [Eumeta japonica]